MTGERPTEDRCKQKSPRWTLCLALSLALATASCDLLNKGGDGGEGSAVSPGSQALDVWAPTTVAYDPSCSRGCFPIDANDESIPVRVMDHSRYALAIVHDPRVDDPIAQWSRCISSSLFCLQTPDSDPKVCVGRAVCPERCKEIFRSKTAELNERAEVLNAFEEVFINVDAPCRPAPEQVEL